MDQKKLKRFYKKVDAQSVSDGYIIELDGRQVKTPNRKALILPTAPLAQQIASEWASQAEVIDLLSMPLTRIANSALDHVGPNRTSVSQEVVRYAGSDLICYREEKVEELQARQIEIWDPYLTWIAETHGLTLATAQGIQHVTQDPQGLDLLADIIRRFDPFRLACLHMATTITGSAVIALALEARFVDVHTAWTAARLDEDWQQEKWGVDEEAAARAEIRLAELRDANRFLDLLKADAETLARDSTN